MGHPTDIFLTKPDDSFICAICHEVLKDASSFKECGHTFCEDCISFVTHRASPTCPTCRKPVHTGSNPNYLLRDIIDKLEVRCPEDEMDESPAKRLKSTGENDNADDDGDDNINHSSSNRCDWKGTVNGLKHHVTSECLLATIMCGEEGCKHTCQRRDMEAHRSSQQGMMLHMELKYENKLKAMEMKYESKYQMMNDRIIVLENKAKLCFNMQCSLPQREIKGRVMYCTRCGVANYCSRGCQTSDWRNHQAYCDRYCDRNARRVQDERRMERRPSANDSAINAPDLGATRGEAYGAGSIVTRRGGDGRRIMLNSASAAYSNLLKDAIFRAIRGQIENTGDSSSGAHVNEVIASLRVDGFSEDEVRNELLNLSSNGYIYSTIDENHFNLADENTAISTRYAYGSSFNDSIIRVLRDLGAHSEDGVYFLDIMAELEGGYDERDLRNALNHLLNEGYVYTTVDDDHYQWAEYPPHDNNATVRR